MTHHEQAMKRIADICAATVEQVQALRDAALAAFLPEQPTPAPEPADLTAEQQVRGVQAWMALDLHQALGHDFDPKSEHQGHDSWADWWANLCDQVRRMVFVRNNLPATPAPEPAWTPQHGERVRCYGGPAPDGAEGDYYDFDDEDEHAPHGVRVGQRLWWFARVAPATPTGGTVDEEPDVGAVVRDGEGREWVHGEGTSGNVYIARTGWRTTKRLHAEPDSWDYVKTCGPLTLVRPATPDPTSQPADPAPDGDEVEALARVLCHEDGWAWHPEHSRSEAYRRRARSALTHLHAYGYRQVLR